mmetsp:Transcript_11358/g.14837  ORF Transcript_11358/g.14837 Transcript_11358/m.14837 type:complete len:188 (-) Transcript_11358:53-616(-)
MRLNLFSSILFVLALEASSYSVRSPTPPQNKVSNERRTFLTKSATIAASAILTIPIPSLADVSDGNTLPEGALQFSRALKAKSDWEEIGKTVSTRGSELSKDEWEGVMGFLRKLYSVGDDMKGISKGMDPTKKKEAEKLIADFQTVIKTADGAARGKDPNAFMILQKKSAEDLENFFLLLQDVPDEI